MFLSPAGNAHIMQQRPGLNQRPLPQAIPVEGRQGIE